MTPTRRSPSLMWATALVVSSAMGELVLAQQPESSPQPTTEELMRALQERDALILDLRRRVEALERQGPPTAGRGPASGQPTAPAPTPSLPAAAPAHDPKSASAPARATTPPAPGQFEVDEQAAERALEQALVVTGALLLPVGQGALQPSFTYIRSEQETPTVLITQGGQLVGAEHVRRDTFNAALFLRFGMPFDSQLEAGIPYVHVKQDEVTQVGFAPSAQTKSNGSGFGDINVGFAKALLHERNWWPNIIGRMTWDTASGKDFAGNIALGSGFNELQWSLTMTKRQDPLVFVGGVSYGITFEKNGIKPGDQLGFSLGVLLAASPETSLRAVLNQTFVDNFKIDNNTVGGSSQVIGTLNLGASSIIGRGKFLDITAGIGLTDGAPNYSIGASVSINFDVPMRR